MRTSSHVSRRLCVGGALAVPFIRGARASNASIDVRTKPLYVFALEQETQGLFDNHDVLYTGAGKVQAAYALTRRLSESRPTLVVFSLIY